MPWEKGQSGNPGGRPKALAEVIKLARDEGINSLRTLIELRDSETTPPAVRESCANSILDRGFGKPSQNVINDPDAPDLSDDVDRLRSLARKAALARIGEGLDEGMPEQVSSVVH